MAAAPPSHFLAVPNVSAHPSTTSVPITVLLYDGPLLCGFNVAIKGLTVLCWRQFITFWHLKHDKGFNVMCVSSSSRYVHICRLFLVEYHNSL